MQFTIFINHSKYSYDLQYSLIIQNNHMTKKTKAMKLKHILNSRPSNKIITTSSIAQFSLDPNIRHTHTVVHSNQDTSNIDNIESSLRTTYKKRRANSEIISKPLE